MSRAEVKTNKGLLCISSGKLLMNMLGINPTNRLVHVLSSADVARRIMLIAKRGKWQFVVKTCC
jgi:hypothetical protein